MKDYRNKSVYKCIIAGDGGVGKSTMIHSILTRDYFPASQITIGVDISIHREAMMEVWKESGPDSSSTGSALSLLLFDLGGQEQFHFIHQAFIIGAKAAVVVYDLTREDSFENIPHWVDLFQKEYPSIPILVIGAKRDLVSDDIVQAFTVKWDKVRKTFASDVNIIGHSTYSSKIPADREEIFTQLWKLAQSWQKQIFAAQQDPVSSKQ